MGIDLLPGGGGGGGGGKKIMSLAQGHNTMMPLAIKPRTSQEQSPMLYHYATLLPIRSVNKILTTNQGPVVKN